VVRGEIYSTEKVIILSTGLVLGAITTPRLIIEEGVIFNGSCKVTAPQLTEAAKGATGNGQRAGSTDGSREPPVTKVSPAMTAPGQRR